MDMKKYINYEYNKKWEIDSSENVCYYMYNIILD
ncbi:hypothetical protein PFNF54_02102 [Plasmodium falciparum NF54]|uniref:Uncharacterized protein n=1 Tax=Plasmodium falciparum (isolate NF54) TaxID=5843 RepID=W7KHW3_PLAFO|nr:hypothetical protein PFNF54_02102 [Plasmodium falciparum NF54]